MVTNPLAEQARRMKYCDNLSKYLEQEAPSRGNISEADQSRKEVTLMLSYNSLLDFGVCSAGLLSAFPTHA